MAMRKAVAIGSAAAILSAHVIGMGGRHEPATSLFLSAQASDVLTFAGLAVSKGIPTAFVGPAGARSLPARAAVQAIDPRDGDIAAVASAFNIAHRDYHASLSATGVLNIEEAKPPAQVEALLSKTSTAFQVDRLPAFAAIWKVGDLLARAPDTGGGVAGNGPPDCPDRIPVSIRLTRPTPRDILNEIASQTQTGWMLLYDLDAPSDKLQLGMLCRHAGESMMFTVRGW
jgi:hypothetical protein